MTENRTTITAAARAAHEANRAWCLANGDNSQPPWDEAAEWVQESAVAGVRAVLADPAITPEQQHDAWSRHKLADGWRCGPEKDAKAKTHPCLVPYDCLPATQRAKDSIFGAVVRSVLIAGGLLEAAPKPQATLARLLAVIDTWRGPNNPATVLLAPLFEIANEAKRALP